MWQPRDTYIFGTRQRLRGGHQKSLHACTNSSKTSDLEQGKFPVDYNKGSVSFYLKYNFFGTFGQTQSGLNSERKLHSQASMLVKLWSGKTSKLARASSVNV